MLTKNFILNKRVTIVSILIGALLVVMALGMQRTTVQSTLLWSERFEVPTVNGHPGYITEWRGADALDKPIIVVLGYDPSDDNTAEDAAAKYADIIADLNSRGYDIIIFDYFDGDADIRLNAENLAHFINVLDDRMAQQGYVDADQDGHPDYELAIAGGSMGGIVTRTMFAQEYESMGVDIFVTVDSPHYGVYLSSYVDWIAAGLDTVAGQQMLHGSDAYNEFYGWLQSVETPSFKTNIIGPMDTAAIALSDGESIWKVSWEDELIHTKYHPVASYTNTIFGEVDFIPYHSAIYADSTSTSKFVWWGYTYYWYDSTHTSYFDVKITNPRDSHGGHQYVILQAMNFIESHWGT